MGKKAWFHWLGEAVSWIPTGRLRIALVIGAVFLTLILAYFHYMFGIRYEFHVFFGLPVVFIAWFVGPAAGLLIAVLAVALWLTVDVLLTGALDRFFVFNSLMRLMIAVVEVWLLRILRQALNRETVLARKDSLTSLSNRRDFFERGAQAIAMAQRRKEPLTAVFIDLDYFKEVNDLLGHEVGDELLKEVAGVIRGNIRVTDVAGRLGGDEFALLLSEMSADKAVAMVERLRQNLLRAMAANEWPVTFSIGVASYEQAPADLKTVISQADELMYKVKKGGRDGVCQRVC